MIADFQLGRPADAGPDRRRHVRRRRQLGRRRARRPERRRGDRGHPPALRSWRGGRPLEDLLRRPRHLRRPNRRRPARNRPLRLRLRDPLPRQRDRALRRRICPGPNPDSLRLVQPVGEVHRPARSGPRSRRRLSRHRPLRPAGRRTATGRSSTAPPIRPATRAISCSRRPREQLDYLRFPLGGLPKPAVREIARELGLLVADKPDSQDICFVPNGDYASVVKKVRPEAARPGEIVDLDGRVLGDASRPDPFHRRPAPRPRDRRPGRAALRRPARAGGAAGGGRAQGARSPSGPRGFRG